MAHVVILMGSKSDEEKVSPCVDVLKSLGIDYVFTVSSAHRTPERTEALVRDEEARGARVFICAAGMAAHLAGAVAARTSRPVIGIPVSGGGLAGMDALFSTVQMPPRLPGGHGGPGQGRGAQRGLAGGPDPGCGRSRLAGKNRGGPRQNAR